MYSMTTTVQVSDETWEELNRRRNCGETMDDVIRGVLGIDQ
jgi:predicted CopG family antitoxin